MTYRITGLPVEDFRPLFGLSDAALAERGMVRVTADRAPGYPCRITLEDASAGETLLLLNHEDHRVATPYRSRYAIYVREEAVATAELHDSVPAVFAGRPIAFRAFDAKGMLRTAALALGDDKDTRIRELLALPEIAYLHAHNAAHGCFAARIDRA